MGHFVGAWVPGVLDAGDKHEDDEPAPKKQAACRSSQRTSWTALPPWLFVDGGRPGGRMLSRWCWMYRLCQLLQGVLLTVCRGRRDRAYTRAATRSTAAAAVVSGLLPYETTATSTTVSIWAGRSPASRSAGISKMIIVDHKGGIISILGNICYLIKKKNPLNHISDLCDLLELQGAVPDKKIKIAECFFCVCGGEIVWLGNRTSTAAAGTAENNNEYLLWPT